MLGVLREVVAAATPGVATTAASSVLFEAPTVSSERYGMRQLPRLRPDQTDPQVGWLAKINADDPIERLSALSAAPGQSPEVQLARGYAALDANNPRVLDECVRQMLTADPWEWRAVWMAGLGALQAQDYANAQSSFNAVYGQVPGELAPKLALAVDCELGGEYDIAENLYRICASTDAAYVTPAAFGLARVRAARRDLAGSLAALELVPSTSRGYPESQRLKADHLVRLATDASGLTEAFAAIAAVASCATGAWTAQVLIHSDPSLSNDWVAGLTTELVLSLIEAGLVVALARRAFSRQAADWCVQRQAA